VTRARPASGFRPANQRAIGTIEMAAIAPAAEAHLAMTSPAVEQPERLPTHGNTDPMLDGTMPCDAYIKGLRNCPMQAPHRRPGGGLETRSRGLLFFGVWRAGYRKDREARLPARRTSQGFAGALTCTRSFSTANPKLMGIRFRTGQKMTVLDLPITKRQRLYVAPVPAARAICPSTLAQPAARSIRSTNVLRFDDSHKRSGSCISNTTHDRILQRTDVVRRRLHQLTALIQQEQRNYLSTRTARLAAGRK